MKFTERRWLAAGLAAAALVAAGVTVFVRGHSPQGPADARQFYSASSVCLLTDSRGITALPASTVWAGLEDASLATHAKVTYLTVNGPATAARAVPYVNSLVEQHCNVIVAAGAPQVSALTEVAARTPKTNFVIVGDSTVFATANLKAVGLDSNTRSQVAQAVEALVNN